MLKSGVTIVRNDEGQLRRYGGCPDINELSHHHQLTLPVSGGLRGSGRGVVISTDRKTIAGNWKIILIISDKYKIKLRLTSRVI